MSAPVAGTAAVRFVGDFDGLTAEVARAGSAGAKSYGSKFGRAMGPVMKQQGKHAESFARGAKVAAAGGAALAVVIGKDLVEKGAAFEKQMSVNAAITGANAKAQARLEKQSIRLGKATFYSAGEAAEAQGELAKGGLSVEKILGGGLPAALSLAEAGELELATAAETTVNAMKLFGLEGKEAGSVADMYATAANRTTADVLDFAMAMKQGGSVTRLAGYDMNETLVVLEALAEAGIKNSDAGTSMKTSVIQLLKPSKKQTELQKELNLHLINGEGHLKNAAELSAELRRATEGETKAERAKTLATLAGTDGIRTLNALYEEGPKALAQLEKANSKQGTAQEVAAKKMDNFAGRWEQFKGSLETTEIVIYKGISPALDQLAEEGERAANRVGDIFEDPDLSGGEKMEKAIGVISGELDRMWDRYDMSEHLVDALDAAIPLVAKGAGSLGLKFAEGFFDGFIHADPATQAVMAAWAIHFIGGRAPFVAAAKFAAAQFGITFAAESAAAQAATGASLAASAGSATASAGMVRPASDWASAAAASKGRAATMTGFGEKKLLEDAGLIGGASYVSKFKSVVSKAMKGLGGLVGGYFAAEFGAKAIEGITGSDLLENQDLKTSLTHGFNTKGVLATEVNALQRSKGFNPKLAEAQIESLEKHFNKTLGKIKSSAAIGMGGINHALDTGLKQADQLWIHGTQPWRESTTRAMTAAVSEIRKGIKAGTIPVKEGQREINRLLSEISLRRGSDPFGLAKATTDSFKKTNAITSNGVSQWAHKLDEMPRASREKSIEATNNMLRAWAQGNPKLERQVANLTDFERRKFGGTNAFLEQDTANAMAHLAQSADEGAGNVGGALSNIFDNLSAALAAVGASKIPTFSLSTLSTAAVGHKIREDNVSGLGRQRGGSIPGTFIVPGTGSGDTFRTAVPAGTWIENRNAARMPFQSGGLTPVALEPGERVWYPERVANIGRDYLEARNSQWPRFQQGGLMSGNLPHPGLVGPEPTRSLGQKAIDTAWAPAQKYLRAHMEPPRILRALHGLEDLTSRGFPYVYGGGHGAFGIQPVDCSGLVSYGLYLADFIDAPMSVQQGSGLYTLGASGPGKFLTWGVRGTSGANAHTMMSVKAPGGKWEYFESGGSGGGAHQLGGWDGSFQFRHMPGFQRGGQVPERAKETIARFGQDAFNPRSKHFVGWGYQSGGQVLKLQKGGGVKGIWAGTSIDKTYALSDGFSGETVPDYAIKAVAEWAGLPGVTMFQITEGESTGHAGMDIPDPPGRSRGLYAINDHYNPQFGATAMRNPILNTLAAKELADGAGGPNAGIWHGSGHVTGWNQHYQGDPKKIAQHLGGKGSAEGDDDHTYKEDVPNVYHGLSTQSLHFPSKPTNLKGLNREIDRWQGELGRYRRVVKLAEKAKKPAIVQALEHNIADISNHLRELRNEKTKVRIDEAKKRFTKRIGRRFARITGQEAAIEAARASYERLTQNAEQIVDLEPRQPELPARASDQERHDSEVQYAANLKRYVDNREMPAYAAVLGSEADWRNSILAAERAAAGSWREGKHLGGVEGRWEERIIGLDAQERQIEALNQHAAAELAAWNRKHDSKDPKPEWLKELLKRRKTALEQLPILKFQEAELRKVLGEARDLFYPGKGRQEAGLLINPAAPTKGSGTFEDDLKDVQGIHFPDGHELLKALPSHRRAGRFGGAIWDTQSAIEELELKVPQLINGIGDVVDDESGAGPEDAAASDDSHNSELADLWKGIAIEANQRNLLRGIEERVYSALPPFGGIAHTGAIVPAARSQERTMILRGQEGVFTEEQMAKLAPAAKPTAGSVTFEQLHLHDDGRIHGVANGQEFDARVRKVNRHDERRAVRGAGRGLAPAGGGWR